MKEIVLDFQLGCAVRSFLDKKFKGKQSPPKVPNAYNYNTSFSEEELAEVTMLDVKNLDSISVEQLSKLPNLKYLSITTDKGQTLSDHDILFLSKLQNLAELSIKGYSGFKTIDVSKFKNLQSLIAVNNPDLETILNIPNYLDCFECFGNRKLKNFREVAYSALEIAENDGRVTIDVCYAPIIFKKIEQYKSLSTYAKEILPNSLSFGDVVLAHGKFATQSNELKHSFNQIKSLNDKVKKISEKVLRPQDSPEEKFSALYGWVCKNIKYDYDALKTNTRRHSIGTIKMGNKETQVYDGLSNGTNSFVNGFIYGECVCEGYAKALHYLCNYNDIKTSLVLCEIPRADQSIGLHSILQYDEGPVRLCDPTWDAGRVQRGDLSLPYFMLTEEEMSKDHKKIQPDKIVYSKNLNIDKQLLAKRVLE